MQVLLNHAIFGDFTEAALFDIFEIYGDYLETETLFEGRILIENRNDNIFLLTEGLEMPGAVITESGLNGCAGPVHVVDKMLLTVKPDGSLADLGPNAVPASVEPLAAPPMADAPAPEDLAPMLAPAIAPGPQVPPSSPPCLHRSSRPLSASVAGGRAQHAHHAQHAQHEPEARTVCRTSHA